MAAIPQKKKRAGSTGKNHWTHKLQQVQNEVIRKSRSSHNGTKSTLTVFGVPRVGNNGRPTTLTEALQAEFVALLGRGHYLNHACDLLQVPSVTVWEWMKRGETEIRKGYPDEPYARFYRAVKAAQGTLIDECLQVIRGGEDRWQAAAWLLERKFPDWYAERKRLELTGEGGGPVEHSYKPDLSKLSTAEMRQLRDIMEKSQAIEVKAEPE
jgi:hypothetical protein